MDYQQIALEVFENKLSYTDDDYITILNILMESYNKSKGICYNINMDLKQEEINLVCIGCNTPQEDLTMELIEDLCIDCLTIKYETTDDEYYDEELNEYY
tara:strand:- start:1672 stop:1971 length:300 start_codon:yes stop_codon:yes gene_type:complete